MRRARLTGSRNLFSVCYAISLGSKQLTLEHRPVCVCKDSAIMRDNFNFSMLPIVQDNLSHVPGVRSLTNLSSNGYYGYQPPLLQKDKQVEPHTCAMEVQFECDNTGSRKRAWDFTDDFREFKKRRQNESSPPFACQQLSASPNLDAMSRKPTHNVPDMPRCIMGHYI